MQLFWGNWTAEGRVALTETESNHAARVVRKQAGDVIWVGNGMGDVAEVRLEHVSPKTTWGTVLRVMHDFGQPPGELHVLLCPTKNLDRTEWAVEKSVELGVSHIHLITAARSERKHANADRLQKIADAAAKQSLKGQIPRIHALRPLSECWSDPQWSGWAKGLFHCAEGSKSSLAHWKQEPPFRAVVAIGPEGDFTPDEIERAERHGWNSLSLGASRLRTETAAVTAVALLLHRWETALVVDGNSL